MSPHQLSIVVTDFSVAFFDIFLVNLSSFEATQQKLILQSAFSKDLTTRRGLELNQDHSVLYGRRKTLL